MFQLLRGRLRIFFRLVWPRGVKVQKSVPPRDSFFPISSKTVSEWYPSLPKGIKYVFGLTMWNTCRDHTVRVDGQRTHADRPELWGHIGYIILYDSYINIGQFISKTASIFISTHVRPDIRYIIRPVSNSWVRPISYKLYGLKIIP